MTDISTYADQIITEIDNDIAEGRIPASVRSFSELHNYLDANDYTVCVGIEYTGTDANYALINAVETEVSNRLAARTTYCTFGSCRYPGHDHTDETDPDGPDGEDLPKLVGIVCRDCERPTHYDDKAQDYRHDDPVAPDCFLIRRAA